MRTIPQIMSWSPRRLYAVSLQIELELTVELLCCVYNLPRICSISPARLSHCLLSNIAIAEENIYILFTPESCSGMSSCHRGVTSLHQPVTYQIHPTWHCSKFLVFSSQLPCYIVNCDAVLHHLYIHVMIWGIKQRWQDIIFGPFWKVYTVLFFRH